MLVTRLQEHLRHEDGQLAATARRTMEMLVVPLEDKCWIPRLFSFEESDPRGTAPRKYGRHTLQFCDTYIPSYSCFSCVSPKHDSIVSDTT